MGFLFGNVLGTITLPTAPTVSLDAPLEWFFNFVTSIFTGNISTIIMVGLGIAALFAAPRIAKRFGKSAMRG